MPCYRSGNETGRSDSGQQRERRKSVVSLLSWPEWSVLFSVLNLSGMCAQSHKVH